MVASSQPLASQAGLAMLMAGGNAADAAVAMAAALAVTEPTSTGIGGDCFALHYEAATRQVTALNGSGRAPSALTIDRVRRDGLVDFSVPAVLTDPAVPASPQFRDPVHAHTVTVPGACAAWCDLLARHGSLPWPAVLAPAIRLAQDGFPVAPITACFWQRAADRLLTRAPGGLAMTIDGRGPRAGEAFRNPGLAATLRLVAEGGAEAFYRGPIAQAVAAAVQAAGGVLTAQDLAAHLSTWDTPISTVYRGVRVWECPPNGQGLAALLALNILSGVNLAAMGPLDTPRWHWMVEAMRLAFADSHWVVADPQFSQAARPPGNPLAPAPLAALLAPDYAAGRRRQIDPARAMAPPERGAPAVGSGTVYCCAVDGAGNACSLMNSNYMGFGTGIVPQGWGFTLQNRGFGFSLDPDHPNALAPGKRPYHTIIPGLLTHAADDALLGPFGVMGGFMQPQGQMQVVVGMVDDGLDPQAALDRLRFCIDRADGGGAVQLEAGLPPELSAGLAALGHTVVPGVSGHARALFGRGQIIRRDPGGVLWGGSDPRADGCAMGF